jgi:ppGpp synthetase/RelA/SpoT-type nucleotidyltranferase
MKRLPATHVLIEIGDEEERLSLRGTICEIQITSLASHVFNELEHDIGYKPHGAEISKERESLEEVRHVSGSSIVPSSA